MDIVVHRFVTAALDNEPPPYTFEEVGAILDYFLLKPYVYVKYYAYVYLYLYFWSRVSGVTTLRRPCGIEYCGCV